MIKNKNKNQKKAQVQMAESIGVTVIVLIMIIIGIAIYSGYQNATGAQKIDEINQMGALELANSVAAMPELRCSDTKINCVDALKVAYFANLTKTEQGKFFYTALFGYANVTIIQVLPNSSSLFPKEQITVYEQKPGNVSQSSAMPVFIPVNLYNPYTNTKSFAILLVKKYY